MSKFITKVYVVQKFTRGGEPREIIAVKLTFIAAHKLAVKHAPAKVIFARADKTDFENVGPDHFSDQPHLHLIAKDAS
jgi:hypothetical protein